MVNAQVRKVGFWRQAKVHAGGEDLPWPTPAANAKVWSDNRKQQFIRQLKTVENYLKYHDGLQRYRGISLCRLCGAANGDGEYHCVTSTGDIEWRWPSGLMHYVVEHNVALNNPSAFMHFIRQFAGEIDSEPLPDEADGDGDAWDDRGIDLDYREDGERIVKPVGDATDTITIPRVELEDLRQRLAQHMTDNNKLQTRLRKTRRLLDKLLKQ